MPNANWQQAILAWRNLPPAEQQRRVLLRIPRAVARSMAFAGEPVDERLLEEELERLLDRPGMFTPPSGS